MNTRIVIIWIALVFSCSLAGQSVLPEKGEKQLLNRNWIARQATYVLQDGIQLTSAPQDFNGWIPAVVPGTVLTTLLENKQIPSPYYGMNNERIPDIYHAGKDFYTYWFVNRFDAPALDAGSRLWLNFRGINYRADVFLNGKRISTTTHEGMFIRRSYDITAAVKPGKNTLAVLVLPPDFPGEANGGQGGDGQIARSVTMHYTPGWDWIQAVRDRNTGIWDEVSLTVTGAVRLQHPQVITRVSGVRQPEGKQADAVIKVSTEVENLTDTPQQTTVSYTVEGRTLSTKVALQPRENRIVALPDMTVKNPRLWWPNGTGKQELYNLSVQVTDGQSEVSDMQQIRIGIRELATEKDAATGGRKFFVNGQKVFIRGGNYIASDWMLRLSPERYFTEVKFHADMNLNMIRIWGGALPERPEFYDACDSLGLLVFQDLSVTGDANGAWQDARKKDSRERRNAYPDNHELFLASVIDQVKMLRNHPGLCLWCGGNEWPAAKDIDDALKNRIMPQYDPTRHFASFSTDTVFTRNTIGGVGDGPYGIREVEWFFSFRSTPFNPELGSIGVPEAAAMRAIMDEKDFNEFPQRNGWTNTVWNYHKYLPYGEQIYRYGTPKTGDDFCRIAQVINYDQYRGLMEGWASNMWNWYTGMLIWKTQNPWTALRGQMYDCYLDVNACYYGTRMGGEPLHIQYNAKTKQVEVANTTFSACDGLSATVRLYAPDGKLLGERAEEASIQANMCRALFEVQPPAGIDGVYFMRLTLRKDGDVCSDNTYWMTTRENDFTGLQELPKANVSPRIELNGNNASVTVKTGEQISFFNHIAVFNRKTGERILPVYYSDNYFTVFPNEEKTVTLSLPDNLPEEDVEVRVSSWN